MFLPFMAVLDCSLKLTILSLSLCYRMCQIESLMESIMQSLITLYWMNFTKQKTYDTNQDVKSAVSKLPDRRFFVDFQYKLSCLQQGRIILLLWCSDEVVIRSESFLGRVPLSYFVSLIIESTGYRYCRSYWSMLSIEALI